MSKSDVKLEIKVRRKGTTRSLDSIVINPDDSGEFFVRIYNRGRKEANVRVVAEAHGGEPEGHRYPAGIILPKKNKEIKIRIPSPEPGMKFTVFAESDDE